jgi:hypothetical protein
MTPQPSLLPGPRLIPDLNLAHQILATVLILDCNYLRPSGAGHH